MTDAEKNRRVAEWLGVNRPPSREYAAARVAWAKVNVTGSVFKLYDGRMIPMPGGNSLKQPEGSDDWNDRYGLYIAEQLGDELTDEIDAYRLPPPAYTSDLNACAEFEKKIMDTPWAQGKPNNMKDRYGSSLRSVAVSAWGKPILKHEIPLLLATATAAQRVDALLAVIGEGE